MNTAEARIDSLPCWRGAVAIETLSGGITNANFLVEDDTGRYVVRLGDDIPVHQIMRFNELAASRAAHAAGLSPAVRYHETGVLVLDFIQGQVLDAAAVADPDRLPRIVQLVRRAHREIPQHLRGPALMFWVFQVLRDYAHTLEAGDSDWRGELPRLLDCAASLEQAVGPVEIVFGHNDLLPANLIDDGERLWLIDWDYAGFNSPLFDLGGLAANNGLDEEAERVMLRGYFEAEPDAGLWRRYQAMKCASALRETLWSMVSEIHSTLDFDYRRYTEDNLAVFEASFKAFHALEVVP